MELIVEEGSIESFPGGLFVRQLSLNSSVRLLSVTADVQVSPAPAASSQSVRCFLAFTGEGSTLILVSNVVR